MLSQTCDAFFVAQVNAEARKHVIQAKSADELILLEVSWQLASDENRSLTNHLKQSAGEII